MSTLAENLFKRIMIIKKKEKRKRKCKMYFGIFINVDVLKPASWKAHMRCCHSKHITSFFKGKIHLVFAFILPPLLCQKGLIWLTISHNFNSSWQCIICVDEPLTETKLDVGQNLGRKWLVLQSSIKKHFHVFRYFVKWCYNISFSHLEHSINCQWQRALPSPLSMPADMAGIHQIPNSGQWNEMVEFP